MTLVKALKKVIIIVKRKKGEHYKTTEDRRSQRKASTFLRKRKNGHELRQSHKNSGESADPPLYNYHFNCNTSSVSCNVQWTSPFSCGSRNQYFGSNTAEPSRQLANVSPDKEVTTKCLL